MKRYILAVTLLLASSVIWAACVTNVNLTNAATTAITGMGAPTAYLWIQGLYNAAEGAGTDSTGVASVGTCLADGNCVLERADCFGGAATDYFIYADWISLPFDGCPGVTGTERAVLLAYDAAGNYVLESRLRSEDWTNWDAVGAIPAAVCSIPTATAISAGSTATQINVNWDNAAAGLYGDYNGAAPGTRLLTTFDVWFYQGATPPVSFVVPGAGWTAGPAGLATSLGISSDMTIPAAVGGQYTYMTRRFYAEGIALPTVSTSLITLSNPSGAPVISSILASKVGLETNVTWTSSDESRVANYQIFWAPVGGQYTAIGSAIQPMGNNHTYLQSVRIPATGNFNVKVVANLVDGTTQDSSVASVKASSVIKNRSRVVPN